MKTPVGTPDLKRFIVALAPLFMVACSTTSEIDPGMVELIGTTGERYAESEAAEQRTLEYQRYLEMLESRAAPATSPVENPFGEDPAGSPVENPFGEDRVEPPPTIIGVPE